MFIKFWVLFFLGCLLNFTSANDPILVCRYRKADPLPAAQPAAGFTCSEEAELNQICASVDDIYTLEVCDYKTGGAVNIYTQWGVRYLYLTQAYANHYLVAFPDGDDL